MRKYLAGIAALLMLASTSARSLELQEASVAELQAAMASGELSARQLTEFFLRRIEAIDRSGPQLNSVIEVNPDALEIAGQLDAERQAGQLRGPLHGIPVLLKDNIDTADRMHTSAGSLALRESIARIDAAVVAQLRGAGAVILGKTNLSEWANFRSTHSSSGWSGRGGQTRNPYVLDRNPCGSSSGSGAAIAAGLAVLAVGTETDGSVTCPAAVSGLVGLKPTVGLVSRSGIIPISAAQDTAGPMARSVADAALLLKVMAGADERDPATAPMKLRKIPDYAHALDAQGLKGARIGVARKLAGFLPEVDASFEEAIAALKKAGAEIVDPADIATQGKFDDDELLALKYEFKDGLNRYLAGLAPALPVHSLQDLIAYNQREAGAEMKWFAQELFEQSQALGPLSGKAYRKARERAVRLAGRQGIDATLKKHHLDALVAPTLGPAWTTDWLNGDHVVGGGSTSAAAVAGYPHLTVPMGLVRELPVGLSFIGAAWSEEKLLRYAYAYEQATRARRPPRYLTTLNY